MTLKFVFRRSDSSKFSETVVIVCPSGWYVTHHVCNEDGRCLCSCYVEDRDRMLTPEMFAGEKEELVAKA